MDTKQPPPPGDAASIPLSFSGFSFDQVQGVLMRPDGTKLSLRPKTGDVLRVLVERGGQVVGREALMQLIWPGVFVTCRTASKPATPISDLSIG